jgi:DNA repair ATPase RecN
VFTELTSTGFDEVNFFLQTHKDSPLVSIAEGASGGELSRVALAIEVVIAMKEEIGTYIFDEVDAGVGGKAAIEVGRRLKALSKVAQVIVVTHLPQVAAWGDTHFVVQKDGNGYVTLSQVRKVSADERIEEIARMLAGHKDSESARKHAEKLTCAVPIEIGDKLLLHEQFSCDQTSLCNRRSRLKSWKRFNSFQSWSINGGTRTTRHNAEARSNI